MKKSVLLPYVIAGVVALAGPVLPAAKASDKCKAAQAYGRVKFVKEQGDYKVMVVESGADLRVQVGSPMPDVNPGMWHVVDDCADFSVQLVDRSEFADFTIQHVNSSPGLN